MRSLILGASLGLTLFSPAQEPGQEGTSPKQALTQFQRDHAGDWVVQWHAATGTPSAIYGQGIPLDGWRENTLEAARGFANQTLEQNRELLGLGSSTFVESIGARMGRTWSFTYEQFFHGLPVIGGRADVRINMKGVVAMLGSKAWPIADTFDTTPAITGDVAHAIAWSQLGNRSDATQPGVPKAPRLVIWGDDNATTQAPVFLAWEVSVSNVDQNGNGPIGRYYVDARTGAVLTFVSDKHECGLAACTSTTHAARTGTAETAPPVLTTVTVMGWTNTGIDAYDALVNTPLVGLQLSVPGVGTVTTDSNGQFTVDIAAAVNISVGALDGVHHAAIIGGSGPTGSFTVNPGVNSTIQLLTSGATTLQTAHTNTTYWVDRANTWVRSIVGNTTQMNTADACVPTVNIASTCNAYYTGNTINFYQAGGGCANTAFSTVIVHEWGHGLDDRYGGISNNTGDGLSEGWGDILGMYLVDSPNLGSGFQTAGVPLRSGNNTTMYGTQTQVHAAGQVWMGFAWKLRENLRATYGTPAAIAISDDIVVGSIVADATNQADAVVQVFLADDDDGNLNNGVPHYAQLSAAAIAKGMPYPEVQVVSITHTALGNTSSGIVPRTVAATIQPISGSITAMRLHYNAGSGAQVRNLHPNGNPDQYVAMLPGKLSGAVSYHLEVAHSSGVTVRLPASGEYSYSIDGGTFSQFWSDNFESGAVGWTSGAAAGTNEWQRGTPSGKSGTSTGVAWIDPSSAPSGTNVYAIDLGNGISNGRYANNVNQWLLSPVVNCSGKTGVRLRFKRWLSVEEGTYDHATITVNGVQVWANPVGTHVQDTAWQTVEYALPMADNNPAVQIEWRLTSDTSLALGGWAIDDVEVGETIVPVVDVSMTMLPEQAVQGSPMVLSVSTNGGPRPYLLAIGDSIGPTIVPGFPILYVGGNVGVIGSATNAVGLDVVPFTAPNVPSATGVFFYSQVLTLDATFTTFVASNRYVNLFTQTP